MCSHVWRIRLRIQPEILFFCLFKNSEQDKTNFSCLTQRVFLKVIMQMFLMNGWPLLLVQQYSFVCILLLFFKKFFIVILFIHNIGKSSLPEYMGK